MEQHTLMIDDFELLIDFERIEAEPENGIEKGYDIKKVMLVDCDQFKIWEEELEDFKSDQWKAADIHCFFELYFQDSTFPEIQHIDSFCSEDEFSVEKVKDARDNLVWYTTTIIDLEKAGKIIQNYICEDMRNLQMLGPDVENSIIDTNELEMRLKERGA